MIDDDATIHTGEPDEERTMAAGSSGSVFSRVERQIGPFLLLESLGRGGQGEVCRARDTRLGRTVALKLLNQTQFPLDDETRDLVRARFEREAEAAAKVGHPGLCPIFEFGETDGTPWIAMQLVEGASLDRQIKRRREAASNGDRAPWPRLLATESAELTGTATPQASEATTRSAENGAAASRSSRNEVSEILAFIEAAARALHAAHRAGLVHRDIKPGNIMVTPERQPVILDFGLARDDASEAGSLTLTGETMGTPAYMPPEQFLGEHDRVDARSDVYALGATLFEALTLVRPFQGATREALRQSVLHEPAPDPRRYDASLRPEIGIVIGCALEKNPDRRYATAEALADDLRRVLDRKPIAARPLGPALRFVRWVQRNPIASTASAALILLLLSVAGTFYLRSAELETLNRDLGESNTELERKTSEARQNFELARSEANAKSAALAEFQRMADLRRLANARAEAHELWPLHPKLLPRLESWRASYAPLFERLSGHRQALAELKAQALPRAETVIEGLSSAPIPEAAEDASPNFGGDAELEFRHENLSRLVRELEVATGEKGLAKDIESRLERSRRIEKETLQDHESIWREARTRIAAHAAYRGLDLPPQLGLIPLGPDPKSGLEEFLHWATHAGAIPRRADDGTLAIDDQVGLIFVLVPGGQFAMGAQTSDPEAPNFDPRATNDEQPVMEVKLAAYFLSKFELNQAQWHRAEGDWPSNFRPGFSLNGKIPEVTALHPVERITWETSQEVMRQLGLDLPTEAQWEFAARAGTTSPYPGAADDSEIPNAINLIAREGAGVFPNHVKTHADDWVVTAPVDSMRPNRFGFHHLGGNVEEWCAEHTVAYPNVAPRVGDGLRVSSRNGHMARGGSFNSLTADCRTTRRVTYAAQNSSGACGVRPARRLERNAP